MDRGDLKTLQNKVNLLRSEGKYKETIEESYYLLKYGKEYNDPKSILIAHISRAASYYCIGDIEEAFNSIGKYDEICNVHGDEEDRLQLYNVLFLLYEYNKDYIKSKETLHKCIELGMKLKKYNIVSNGYSNYSHIYLAENNYEKALEMATLGIEIAKLHEPTSPILTLRVTLNLAQVHIELGYFDSAGSLIDEMMNNPILETFIRERSQCYMLQGSWYSKQQLFWEAFESYTTARDLVESYSDVYLLKTIQEERCRLCELMNDVQLGYMVQKEYIALLHEIGVRELALTALKLDIKHSLPSLERKANTDALTELYNRSYIEKITNDWLKDAILSGELVSCIVFDIHQFKSINDTYGRLFGDKVLREVSRACSHISLDNGLIGRYGGDVFVIVMKGATLERTKQIREEIQHILMNLRVTKDIKSVSIKSSIGISNNSEGNMMSFDELFHCADQELYKAKQISKNQKRTNDN